MNLGYKSTRTQVITLLLALGLAGASAAYDLQQAAAETGLSPAMIRAIALEESQRLDERDGQVRPWPWVLNVQGHPMFFGTRDEAEEALLRFYAQGIRNIDVGALQVNIRWNGDLAERPEDLLDPRVNLWAFAQVVRECQSRVGMDYRAVLACYHAGDHRHPRGQAYASRVINRYNHLKGFAR